MNWAWPVLLVAGLFEVAWAIGLEYSDGLSNPTATGATVAALVVSMVLLAKAVEQLSVGTAYAVWTGIGAVGTAVAGVYLFDEPAGLVRAGCIGLVVAGIAGLKLTG